MTLYHIGRSWPNTGTRLEDACPCPQEPCGLIAEDRIDPECEQHSMRRNKTLRASHPADTCADALAPKEDA